MPKLFQKKQEDFMCGNCGKAMRGTGYTNHCSACLFSKHVDVNPGDRKESCQGLMEPVSIEQKDGEFVIIHRCQKCSKMKKNKTAAEDDPDKILELSLQG